MEQVLRGLNHILIYIDDVLIHTDTHEKHLEALEQVLMRLHQHHLKINLDKCLFGDRKVSYLGFTLTPEGIKPGEAKLKTIKQATPPEDVKGIHSFMGLCNFFRHHIQDFAIIAAPLFKLTRQDSEYRIGPLTKAALTAFQSLKSQLSKWPVLAFPRHDWKYLLITNAYLPDKDSTRGLCATLAQQSNQGKVQIISHASRQLIENDKNYTKFPLETTAAAWGMDNFNEYLKGSKFTLYKDLTNETTLGTTQIKTLNQLRTTMVDHDFEVQDWQKSTLPEFLKKRQREEDHEHKDNEQKDSDQDQAASKIIHVNLIKTDLHPKATLLIITDDTQTFSQVAVLTNDDIKSTASTIWHRWCQPYGPPNMIWLNQGKVRSSQLESQINKFMLLGHKMSCWSRKEAFNQEVQLQWQQNQSDISAEEFAQNWNFLCNLQNLDAARSGCTDDVQLNNNNQILTDDENFTEFETDAEEEKLEKLSKSTMKHKRKQIGLCRHKLQERAYPRTRKLKTTLAQPERLPEQENKDSDYEWLQLIQIEKVIEKHKQDLLRTSHQYLTEEDDSLDDEDWSYINAI